MRLPGVRRVNRFLDARCPDRQTLPEARSGSRASLVAAPRRDSDRIRVGDLLLQREGRGQDAARENTTRRRGPGQSGRGSGA